MLLDLVRRTARRAAAASSPAAVPAEPVPAPHYQGFIDERSTAHLRGWVRDLADPARRIAYEIVLPSDAGETVLASGIADERSGVLVAIGVGDGTYALSARFDPPLSPDQRDRVFVRPAGEAWRLELAPGLMTQPHAEGVPARRIIGHLDERSDRHVAGWLHDVDDPAARLDYEVVLDGPDGAKVLDIGVADQASVALVQLGVGDGRHAFTAVFPRALPADEIARVSVRAASTGQTLPPAPELRTVFEPIGHVAMDIVNNGNLRCPFCVYDYTGVNRTKVMDEATFDATLRLLPYVTDGNFWLSCLHEATLHPQFERFIARVPPEWRRRLMFTTNLAKRMPDSYFTLLADSGVDHVNVSLESFDPAIYERLRKGARHRIFQECWDNLLGAVAAGSAPPRLRYNLMAYRSNHREIPAMIDALFADKRAFQVEVRDTFPEPHIPQSFRDAEFMDAAEWTWLEDQLARYPADRVILLGRPPRAADGTAAASKSDDPAEPYVVTARVKGIPPRGVPRPFGLRIEWDGTLFVYGEQPGAAGETPRHEHFVITNIHRLRDPLGFLMAL
jgi:molybdenum cofactor biosynthesis enzyme MoaA